MDFPEILTSRMRESYINVVGLVRGVHDTLLTYPKECRAPQQLYKPKSSIALPTELRRLKKNEGKVMKLFLSTLETDINTFNRLPTLGTCPG